MEVMEAMSRRRSLRAYLPQQILNEKRDEILKAANAAPVGMGKYQNVRLSVIQSAALLEKLDRCGAAFLGDPSLRPTYGAPTVILVSVSQGQQAGCSILQCGLYRGKHAFGCHGFGLGQRVSAGMHPGAAAGCRRCSGS